MIDTEFDNPATPVTAPTANTKTRTHKPRAEKPVSPGRGADKEAKIKPTKHAKETANANALASAWIPMNWNEKGGKYAEYYPFVVSRPGVFDPNRFGRDGNPSETIICLAGPTSRLLRFASERAALVRATRQNQTNMELF